MNFLPASTKRYWKEEKKKIGKVLGLGGYV